MNILISNDDGIFAPGFKTLAQALSSIEGINIFACAPDRERSVIGHALTLVDDIFTQEYPIEKLGSGVRWAKSCTGSPADCVRLGLYALEQEGIKIDLVCSGINNGANTGSDINYSGTMAAAREAILDGYPSIAFSSGKGLEYLDNFLEIVPEIISRFEGRIPYKMMLNVNAPNIPWDKIKGYKSAHLAHVYYPPLFDPKEANCYGFGSTVMHIADEERDCDTALIKDGYITVSLIPLLQDTKQTMKLVDELLG